MLNNKYIYIEIYKFYDKIQIGEFMKNRIKELAKLVAPYQYLADIGCDHGYLIKEAFNNGIVYAQAIDNKLGPLTQAKSNLISYKDKVCFNLSSGLKDLKDNIEVVVIAGMGGNLIIDIINEDLSKLNNVKRLIIQANKNIPEVREFITKNCGYYISSEKIIFEDAIYYELIVFEKGYREYSNEDYFFGPILLSQKSDIFIQKWKNQIQKYKSLNSIQIEDKINYIEGVLGKLC